MFLFCLKQLAHCFLYAVNFCLQIDTSPNYNMSNSPNKNKEVSNPNRDTREAESQQQQQQQATENSSRVSSASQRRTRSFSLRSLTSPSRNIFRNQRPTTVRFNEEVTDLELNDGINSTQSDHQQRVETVHVSKCTVCVIL